TFRLGSSRLSRDLRLAPSCVPRGGIPAAFGWTAKASGAPGAVTSTSSAVPAAMSPCLLPRSRTTGVRRSRTRASAVPSAPSPANASESVLLLEMPRPQMRSARKDLPEHRPCTAFSPLPLASAALGAIAPTPVASPALPRRLSAADQLLQAASASLYLGRLPPGKEAPHSSAARPKMEACYLPR